MFPPQFNSMAAALTMLLFVFHIFTVSALQTASGQDSSQRSPHLTSCVSNNMETFYCRWDVGTFQNLSELGDVRLFYMNKKRPNAPPTEEWSECPHYSTDRSNECFFNENYTTIWTCYSVQLRSRDQAVLYDEDLFYIQDIVQPDPPFGLNWTLLNISVTSAFYDIMLSWKPPQSADVEMGWMRLQYEVQHRSVDSDRWEVVDPVKSTQRTLYGLQTNVDHEVRVRCKMLGGKDYGEFSDSVFIHIPSKVSRFPVAALLIFGALCLVAILMLVIISQQEKLMVILLPPVPGPKIRGIDTELLKKGKLRELVSILGGPPDLRSELYNNDPWVEFIDLDIEEQNDRLTDLDTDCLMERSLSSNCSPLSIGFRDDDSGRASCCDPDLPSDAEAPPFHALIPCEIVSENQSSPASSEPSSPIQSPTTGDPPLVAPVREALYTQVSEVRSSGKVLLSPEEQTETEKTTCKDTEKDVIVEKEKEREKEKEEIRLLVVNADHGGYTSELNAAKISPRSSKDLGEPYQTGENLTPVQSPLSGDYQRPYHESDNNPVSPFPPAPVYTVVEGVDKQNSLLLTPNSTPAPQLIITKTMPTPDGYLTPDLLGNITP
ncbi:growth hormone receptor b isoform X1 [Scomber japonicus]|uniref:growth hormone receptor b isoform X1 n=2 Tax=Scomber japonicus TaxID=13676 RepID=UPI002305AA79|nr:growth hormone receptor b isoform X1 [Scomber japonicus]